MSICFNLEIQSQGRKETVPKHRNKKGHLARKCDAEQSEAGLPTALEQSVTNKQ